MCFELYIINYKIFYRFLCDFIKKEVVCVSRSSTDRKKLIQVFLGKLDLKELIFSKRIIH